MKIIKYLVLFILFTISCTQKNVIIENMISSDSVQYWKWKKSYSDTIFWFISRFDNHGNIKWYWTDKHGNIRSVRDPNDQDKSYKWFVTKDSILRISSEFKLKKIIKCTKDTIILETIDGDKFIDTLFRQTEKIKVINKGDQGDTLKKMKSFGPL